MWKGFFKNPKSTLKKYKQKKETFFFSRPGFKITLEKFQKDCLNKSHQELTIFKAIPGCQNKRSILKSLGDMIRSVSDIPISFSDKTLTLKSDGDSPIKW